jgi:hypothetical protein
MGYNYLAAPMQRERKRQDLEAYDLHALRYRGIRDLASAGGNDDEIARYAGQSTKATTAKHPRQARQEMRLRQAQEKRS